MPTETNFADNKIKGNNNAQTINNYYGEHTVQVLSDTIADMRTTINILYTQLQETAKQKEHLRGLVDRLMDKAEKQEELLTGLMNENAQLLYEKALYRLPVLEMKPAEKAA